MKAVKQKSKLGKSSGKNTKVHMLDMDLKDILREHALRFLPAKTLFRSLAVSRDWKLQISTPFFAHNQSVSCRSFSGIFVQSPGCPPFFISLDQMAYGVPDQELAFLPEPVDVKASTNGLLCCVGRGSDRTYYVCNPVNQQWKKLPTPGMDHGSDPAIALVFDPSVLNFVADFKVVCVFASTDIEEAYEFEIYSSHQDSWKVSSEMYFIDSCISFDKVEKPVGGQFGRAVYLKGVVYWLTSSGKILSFDMKTQKAAGLPLWEYGGFGAQSPLGTIDSMLCTSCVSGYNISLTVNYGKHTNTMSASVAVADSRKYHVSRLDSEVVRSTSTSYDRPKILVTWDGIVVLQVGSKIFSHDTKKHETKALLHGDRMFDVRHVFPYVNSLVSLV